MIRDDRPAHETEEIEITPEMIEAGMDELRDHHFGEDLPYLLECLYRAMAYASPAASVIKPCK